MEFRSQSFGNVVSPVTQSKNLLRGICCYCHPLDGLRTSTKLSLQDEAYKRNISSKVLRAHHLYAWVVSDVARTEAASSVSMPPNDHVIVQDCDSTFQQILDKDNSKIGSNPNEVRNDGKWSKKNRVRFSEDCRQKN